jgi:flagellar hook-associated protein 2
MALSSPGIGSNMDVNGIVTQLMAVERKPLAALDKREAGFQAKLTAYGTLRGARCGTGDNRVVAGGEAGGQKP